jgi:hypothetical protein
MVVLPIDQAIREDNEALRKRVAELERIVEELRKTVEEQARIIEEWKRGHRARPRRGSKRKSGQRMKPGRKDGHEGDRCPTTWIASRRARRRPATTAAPADSIRPARPGRSSSSM